MSTLAPVFPEHPCSTALLRLLGPRQMCLKHRISAGTLQKDFLDCAINQMLFLLQIGLNCGGKLGEQFDLQNKYPSKYSHAEM